MLKISKHFTMAEFERTSTALPNNVGVREAINIAYGVHTILEPLRQAIGIPITITSGYRSKAVNDKVGGVKNSQHLTGNAADITFNLEYKAKVIDFIRTITEFDQLLEGKNFLHVSWTLDRPPRKQFIPNYYK